MAGLHVAIRVDAGGRLGVGHAMRCSTLGAALTAAGHRVTVVTASLPGWVERRFLEAGATIEDTPPSAPDVWVVDGYTLGAELEALEATKLAVGRMADDEPNADLEVRLVSALRKEVARQQRGRPMWPALVASGAAAAALAWSFLQWQDQKTGTPVATTSTSTEAYQAQSDGSNFFGGPAPVLVSAPKNGR